jgi:bacteriorhodopsin
MKLLTSDQGTIVLGIFSACTSSSIGQTCFYLCGVAYGFTTFYTAASVYVEAWKSVPDECKSLLKVMAYFFYSGWLMFPVLFVVGPEGAGHLSDHGSTIGHSIADLLSKQSWGVCEYLMENKLHVINERLEMEEEEEEAKLALVGASGLVRTQRAPSAQKTMLCTEPHASQYPCPGMAAARELPAPIRGVEVR